MSPPPYDMVFVACLSASQGVEGAPQRCRTGKGEDRWRGRWLGMFGAATKVKYVQAQGELHFERGEFFKTISTLGKALPVRSCSTVVVPCCGLSYCSGFIMFY